MTNFQKPLVIVGAGGLAREIFEWFGVHTKPSLLGDVAGYVADEGQNAQFEANTSLQYLGTLESLANKARFRFVVGIGDPSSRRRVVSSLKGEGASFQSFVHPTAIVASTARIGDGCILFPYVVVSSNATVGNFVAVNSYSGIGHDVTVGDFTTISAQVDLTGNVRVGEAVLIGSGARVAPGKTIADSSKIGAGVTVIRSTMKGDTILPTSNKILRNQ